MLLIKQFWTLKSGAWAQLKLQNRYFVFLVTFVICITTVGVSVQRTLKEIIETPSHLLPLMAESLPAASHFYLNYVLVGCFSVVLELLRVVPCITFFFYTRCTSSDVETARSLSEPEDQDFYGMGARSARVALIMVLAIVFSTVQPLMVVFACLYFFCCNIVYAYLFVFAETKKPDLGGAFWLCCLKHLLFALCLYVALMIGILSAQGRAGQYAAAGVAPLFVVLSLSWDRLGQFNWEILPFETLADVCHEGTRRKSFGCGDQVMGMYIQPECHAERRIAGLHPDIGT